MLLRNGRQTAVYQKGRLTIARANHKATQTHTPQETEHDVVMTAAPVVTTVRSCPSPPPPSAVPCQAQVACPTPPPPSAQTLCSSLPAEAAVPQTPCHSPHVQFALPLQSTQAPPPDPFALPVVTRREHYNEKFYSICNPITNAQAFLCALCGTPYASIFFLCRGDAVSLCAECAPLRSDFCYAKEEYKLGELHRIRLLDMPGRVHVRWRQAPAGATAQ